MNDLLKSIKEVLEFYANGNHYHYESLPYSRIDDFQGIYYCVEIGEKATAALVDLEVLRKELEE